MNPSRMPHWAQARNSSLRTHAAKASQNQLDLFIEKVDMEQKRCVKSAQNQKIRLLNELKEIHRVYVPRHLPLRRSSISEVTKNQKPFLDDFTKTEKIEEKTNQRMSAKGKVRLSRRLTDPQIYSSRIFSVLPSSGRINSFPTVSRTTDNFSPTSAHNDVNINDGVNVKRKVWLLRRVTRPQVQAYNSRKSFSLSQDRRRNNSCPTVIRTKDVSTPKLVHDHDGVHDSINSASLSSPPSVSESSSRSCTATSYRAFKKLVRAKKQPLAINVEGLKGEVDSEEICFAFVTPARVQNTRRNSEELGSLGKDSVLTRKTRGRSFSVPSRMPLLENLSMDDDKLMNVAGTSSNEKIRLYAQPANWTGGGDSATTNNVLDDKVKLYDLKNGQGINEYHDNNNYNNNNKQKSVSFAGNVLHYF